MKKLLGFILIALALGAGLFLLIQLVPYGRQHTNPPVVSEPQWGSPQARQIAQRACFDCHSNETVWPWYSNIAPISWLVQRDVDEGRQKLNFSDWRGGRGEGAEETAQVILEGEMPPPYYLITHTQARLSAAEKQALIDGLGAVVSGN